MTYAGLAYYGEQVLAAFDATVRSLQQRRVMKTERERLVVAVNEARRAWYEARRAWNEADCAWNEADCALAEYDAAQAQKEAECQSDNPA